MCSIRIFPKKIGRKVGRVLTFLLLLLATGPTLENKQNRLGCFDICGDFHHENLVEYIIK